MSESDIEPAGGASARGQIDLERFESNVHGLLTYVDLPGDDLFDGVAERRVLVNNLPAIVASLPDEVRERSRYISKMVAASSVGLFDAALNYLWDELVSELRARVKGFDLRYFFDIVAGGNTDMRKGLNDESDLPSINDDRLLRGAAKLGLLTDVGFDRLNHVRIMRNHASAAHPNQNALSGLELGTYLQTCINEVINTKPDTVSADTVRLLKNVKEDALSSAEVDAAGAFFKQLPSDRANMLGNGLFGLYTANEREAVVADNVRRLWPKLWPFIEDATRFNYGLQQARASASAETGTAKAARELLDLVDDGNSYLTAEVRALDIRDALDALDAAHQGMDNFYNEPGPARRLESLVGPSGDVPQEVRTDYVLTVVECYLGNGFGVASGAADYYHTMITRFSSEDAGIALRTCLEPEFSSLLATRVGKKQWDSVLNLIEPKLVSRPDKDLLKAIDDFTGSPAKLRLDSEIRALAEAKV